jgi:glycosyltransferase involved in cell wall biosynthesis
MSNILVKPIKSNNERPMWSVMIPHYNRNKYLNQALNSVLIQDQGEDRMEIWVVDDCSDQGNTETMVEEIGKGRVKFYRQKENVGQLNNFETCLNLSRGVLIHLLHCDDFVLPGFYDKLGEPLISDNTLGAAFTRHNSVNEENKILITSEEINSKPGIIKDFMLAIAERQMIQTPAIVVKREVYETLGGFNKNLNWTEDWEMWVRIACNYDFYYDPEILASYRIHDASNTGSSFKTGRFIDDALVCMKIYLNYLPVNSLIKAKIFSRAKYHILKYALYVSRKFKQELSDDKTALLILKKSFKLSSDIPSCIKIIREILRIILSKFLLSPLNDKISTLKTGKVRT